MHPDTPDDEVLTQAIWIDDLIHKEIVSDSNYTPKTLEEAKQHPLWIDGDIGIVKKSTLLMQALTLFLLVAWIFLAYVAKGYTSTIPLIIIIIHLIAPAWACIQLDSGADPKTGKKPLTHAIILIALVAVPLCHILSYTVFDTLVNNSSEVRGLYSDMTWFIFSVYVPISVIAAFLPFMFDYKAYKINYMIKK